MKHRFSRMLISMFVFLCPTFVRARFGRRKTDAPNETPPSVFPVREKGLLRATKFHRPPKQIPVKRKIYTGRIWRANYRAIREFRMAPSAKEPGIDLS